MVYCWSCLGANDLALKPTKSGEYHIKTLKEAKEALVLFQSIKGELDEIREREGMAEMEQDGVELKKAVTRFAVSTKTERIDFDDGVHATLVSQFYGAEYIATVDEIPASLPENRKKVVPLQTIIEKKFKSKIDEKGSKARKVWMKITKRVVDKEAIDQLVAEGVFKVDDLAPAFVEKEKAPYLRIFED